MADPNLFVVCGIAFLAVMSLLSFLAVVMRVITAIFPVSRSTSDPALVSAIHSTVAAVYPNARVVTIKEV